MMPVCAQRIYVSEAVSYICYSNEISAINAVRKHVANVDYLSICASCFAKEMKGSCESLEHNALLVLQGKYAGMKSTQSPNLPPLRLFLNCAVIIMAP